MLLNEKTCGHLGGRPTPYREPLFERLARSADYDIQVFYCRDHQPRQPWRLGPHPYPARYLKNLAPESWHGRLLTGAINLGVWRELGAFHPHALIVYGYTNVTTLLAFLWATTHRIPILMRTDSNVLEERGKPRLNACPEKVFSEAAHPAVSAFLSVGTMNSRVLATLRGGAGKDFPGALCCK